MNNHKNPGFTGFMKILPGIIMCTILLTLHEIANSEVKVQILKKIIKRILIVWVVIIAIYGITRFYQFQLNVTDSMPQRFWITHVGDKNLKVGDYVVFMFHDFRMKKPDDFEFVVKQVGGVWGDKIKVNMLNNQEKSLLKSNTASLIYTLPNGSLYPVFDTLSGNHFSPLTEENITIPKNCYFVHGQHQPSFDSRYKEFGLVCDNQIYGKSYPLF